MKLVRLCVTHLRNLAEWVFEPHGALTAILGPNGSGKTSLIEAIYLLGHGRSFRTSQIDSLISAGAASFAIHGTLRDDHTETVIGLSKSRRGDTIAQVDGRAAHNFAELTRALPLQLMTPDSLSLFTAGPSLRRALLDWGCFYADPRYLCAWKAAKRIVKQRNVLLKSGAPSQQLRLWDRELCRHTTQLTQYRQAYLQGFQPILGALCQRLLPAYPTEISFFRGWEHQLGYAEALEKNLARDRLLGYTGSGAHKADLRIHVGNRPVEEVLSRGELKNLLCAFRFAQGQYLYQTHKVQALYLLDDFASELDAAARTRLRQVAQGCGSQIFLTAVNESGIGEGWEPEGSRILYLSAGRPVSVFIPGEVSGRAGSV